MGPICDTVTTSAGENLKLERSRFDMVEFGEQLRRAREQKGMTQQSLAEQLYVTRQSVSRWECGDRYPDLLTTKKISQILEVSLDDLLSGKEMTKVVERNPVIEKKSINNIMIALYAFVVITFAITIVDIVLRIPFISGEASYSNIEHVLVHILGLAIQVVSFSYGLFQALRGTLSPKRMGVVIVAYFGSMCITNSVNYTTYLHLSLLQMLFASVITILPNFVGAVAAFFYFFRTTSNKAYVYLIYLTAAWEIFTIIHTYYRIVLAGEEYLAMNTSVNLVLKVLIYGLIIYQTYVLGVKRKNAIAMSDGR